MMHAMEACMDVSITTILCSHIHAHQLHMSLKARSLVPMIVPNHIPMSLNTFPITFPVFPLGYSIPILQFWDTQNSGFV